MTFHGFDQETIRAKKEKLLRRVEEIENMSEEERKRIFVPGEEVLKELAEKWRGHEHFKLLTETFSPDEPDSQLEKSAGIGSLLENIKRDKLSSAEADSLYRFARIIVLAEKVFEKDALEWLRTPQHGLGGAIPIDVLQTDEGAREVEELLLRIEHGVIS
jgi:putative toxin-antitoxin system antitoxin component (TIGR02293 family)